jgi:glyoxylase-like metal-dependent hydrolase (beta-lactamase superfamily II)
VAVAGAGVEEPTDWTEPGAFEVAPGVHRVPLPLPTDGLRAVNVYVIETDHGLTVVDGGWAITEARRTLDAALDQVGRTVRDITSFLVTHVHRDHYTQAIALRREVGARVALGLQERRSLELIHRDRSNSADDPHVRMLHDAGAHDMAELWASHATRAAIDLALWEDPDVWLDGDHTIEVGSRSVRAVHTPGHTQGHFVFADLDAGLLFAGDHVLPRITPSIGFEPALAEQPLGDFLGSLAKVQTLPDLTLLPAHGPVAASTHARVDELLAHHEHRLALCLDAVRASPGTPYAVARELPWTRHEKAFGDLDLFNAALATLETRAHLQLLLARGQVAGEWTPDGVVYSATAGRGPGWPTSG